ncbi:MAG: hypothetical protein ACLFMN_04420 [Desulfobacterales bacterium]
MKRKAMIVLAAITMFGLLAATAWAGSWDGPRGRGGPGYSANAGPQSQAFLEETADLRSELSAKRGEYQALMSRENPDPKKAARVQREMQEIREQIRAKAQTYQDSSEYGRYSDRGGHGGRLGHHRGGRGGGYCW